MVDTFSMHKFSTCVSLITVVYELSQMKVVMCFMYSYLWCRWYET